MDLCYPTGSSSQRSVMTQAMPTNSNSASQQRVPMQEKLNQKKRLLLRKKLCFQKLCSLRKLKGQLREKITARRQKDSAAGDSGTCAQGSELGERSRI